MSFNCLVCLRYRQQYNNKIVSKSTTAEIEIIKFSQMPKMITLQNNILRCLVKVIDILNLLYGKMICTIGRVENWSNKDMLTFKNSQCQYV